MLFDSYYAASDDDAKRDADLAFSDEVQHEDLGICEDVQRGFASGSYVPGRLNLLRETGVHHFHELLRAAYRNARSSRSVAPEARSRRTQQESKGRTT